MYLISSQDLCIIVAYSNRKNIIIFKFRSDKLHLINEKNTLTANYIQFISINDKI